MNSPHRYLLLFPAVAILAACAAEPDTSVVVSIARAPGENCDFSDPTKYIEGGAVDMSVYGDASSYFQVFSWESQLQQITTTVNGDQISGPVLNTFVANRVELSYILVGGTNPPPGIINMAAAIPAGGTADKASVGVELLTPEAAAAGNAAAVTGTSQTLLVTFQVAGNVVGGAGLTTNPVTFPLTLFRCPPASTDFNCAEASQFPLACPTNYHSQVTSCNIPGRDIPLCVHN